MAAEIERHNLNLAPHQIIIRPLVTEKGMHKANRNNAYAFEVNRLAGKDDIRHAIEELFDVKVTAVRTQNRKGKPRRTKMRRASPSPGRRPSSPWTRKIGSTSSK